MRAFLDDGRFPISNAHVERLLRVVSTFRKNSLFVGSLAAGERYANLLTILLNCELAGVNPYVYLVDVIDKISADWPSTASTNSSPAPGSPFATPNSRPQARLPSSLSGSSSRIASTLSHPRRHPS